MSHANNVSSSPPPTTSSGSRSRTNRSRRPPLPPDTAASGINDLPRREFFSEGSDDEDYDDEEDEEEEDVFAFNRPVTAAQPIGASSSGHGTAPPSGRPTTAGISWAQEAAEEEEPAHVGSSTGPGTLPYGGPTPLRDQPQSVDSNNKDTVPTPTGVIDVGGHLPDTTYDVNNPPPFSGKNNPNNSSFAFNITGRSYRPRSGQSLFDRIHKRRKPETGETSVTTMTALTGAHTDDSAVSDSVSTSDLEHYSQSPRRRISQGKRPVSSAPPISEDEVPSDDDTLDKRRGVSQGSIGMTELTGDMTVPDGMTTWGDGMGGLAKGVSEGEMQSAMDVDFDEEDSPYPEVRASVSNIDDPEMPGKCTAVVVGLALIYLSYDHPSLGPWYIPDYSRFWL